MNEIFTPHHDVIRDLLHREIDASKDLRKHLPTIKAVRECCTEDVLNEVRLTVRHYLLQHFATHKSRLKPMRTIMDILVRKKGEVLRIVDVLPTSLSQDGDIAEQTELLRSKRRSETKDVQRDPLDEAAEILLKAGFVYPHVHEMMNKNSLEFIKLMDGVSAFGKKRGHHVNMQDRTAARYLTEYFLNAKPNDLIAIADEDPDMNADVIRTAMLPSDSVPTRASRDTDRTRGRSRRPSRSRGESH